MKRIFQDRLLQQTRNVRRRVPTAAATDRDLLSEGATYADMHHAFTDVVHGVPYRNKDIDLALEKSSKEIVKEKNRKMYAQKKVDPKINFDHIPIEEQCVLLFPGQGAQYVGMGKKVVDCQASKRIFDEASTVLGYDIEKICLEGPDTKLNQTLYCQPAVFVSSIAAFEKLKTEDEGVSTKTTDVAGFSVGEFAALVAGGILQFSDAMKIVKRRAEAMHECNQLAQSGMATIHVNASSRLEEAMRHAKEHANEQNEPPICEIANYLFCGVKVIGASEACLRFIEDNQTQYKYKVLKRLAVSGAFHTSLMSDAIPQVLDELRKVELRAAVCNVYSNFLGQIFPPRKGEIKNAIANQVTSPVKWEQIQQLLFRKHQEDKFPRVIEIGPGKQLGTMWFKTSKKAYKTYEHYSC